MHQRKDSTTIAVHAAQLLHVTSAVLSSKFTADGIGYKMTAFTNEEEEQAKLRQAVSLIVLDA